jgi:hypothetical protein
MDLDDDAWRSIGPGVPSSDDQHWKALARGLLSGKIACLDEQIVYARSSDGTVRGLHRDGALLWEAQVPSFVAMEHEYGGERGVRHGPPEGATEVSAFLGVARLTEVVAVQVVSVTVLSREVSIFTVFVDPLSGQLLGKDDSLPQILAAGGGRIAVAKEGLAPGISVHAIAYR